MVALGCCKAPCAIRQLAVRKCNDQGTSITLAKPEMACCLKLAEFAAYGKSNRGYIQHMTHGMHAAQNSSAVAGSDCLPTQACKTSTWKCWCCIGCTSVHCKASSVKQLNVVSRAGCPAALIHVNFASCHGS